MTTATTAGIVWQAATQTGVQYPAPRYSLSAPEAR